MYYDQFGVRPIIKDVPAPQPAPRSVIVEVSASGVCRSDWHGWMGHDPDIRLPHVPGHEFAGRVWAVGSAVEGWSVGERVTTPFVQACGHCRYCRANNHQVCSHQEQAGFTCWGSFAALVEVKYADVNLVRIPDTMSDAVAAVLGCRFGTSYRAVRSQAMVQPGDTLAIFGAGGVGLSALLISSAMKVQTIVIDPNPAARRLAASLGAAHVFAEIDDAVISEIRELSQGGVAATIDAVGHPVVLTDSFKLLARRGRHVQVGLIPGPLGHPTVSMDRLIAHELEIVGSHGLQAPRYAEMLAFVETHQLPIQDMIAGVCSLSEAVDLLTSMDQSNSSGVTVITEL